MFDTYYDFDEGGGDDDGRGDDDGAGGFHSDDFGDRPIDDDSSDEWIFFHDKEYADFT